MFFLILFGFSFAYNFLRVNIVEDHIELKHVYCMITRKCWVRLNNTTSEGRHHGLFHEGLGYEQSRWIRYELLHDVVGRPSLRTRLRKGIASPTAALVFGDELSRSMRTACPGDPFHPEMNTFKKTGFLSSWDHKFNWKFENKKAETVFIYNIDTYSLWCWRGLCIIPVGGMGEC